MKAIVTGNFPFPTGTASAKRILNVAKGLEHFGVQVHILPMSFPLHTNFWPPHERSFSDLITFEGLDAANHQLPLRNPLSQKPLWLFNELKITKWAIMRFNELVETEQPDLVFVYGKSYRKLAPILQVAKARGIPSVLDIVESQDHFYGFGGRFSPVYWDLKKGRTELPTLASLVTVIASGLKEEVISSGAKDTFLLPAIETFSNQVDVAKERCVDKPDLHYDIVCTTSLIDRDDPGYLLNTIRRLATRRSRVRLIIIGKYEQNRASLPITKVLKLDPTLGKHVILKGSVSTEELYQAYASADGLLLSRRDHKEEELSFPTRLVEYLQTGKPVFAASVGDIPRYLKNGEEAYLYDPRSEESLDKAIEDFENKPRNHALIGKSGFEAAKRNFCRNQNILKLLKHLGLHT